MNEITIREYESEDWLDIERIHDTARKMELALAGLSRAFVPLAEAAVCEGLFDYTVCVALLNSVVVGFGAYSEDELAWLYIAPEAMRCGVGRALVRHMVMQTKTRPLLIEVLKGNDPAKKLYEAEGFAVVETRSGSMPGNESFRVTVDIMQLK